jgi:hypothetical protein
MSKAFGTQQLLKSAIFFNLMAFASFDGPSFVAGLSLYNACALALTASNFSS